jgi:hypothetical protein
MLTFQHWIRNRACFLAFSLAIAALTACSGGGNWTGSSTGHGTGGAAGAGASEEGGVPPTGGEGGRPAADASVGGAAGNGALEAGPGHPDADGVGGSSGAGGSGAGGSGAGAPDGGHAGFVSDDPTKRTTPPPGVDAGTSADGGGPTPPPSGDATRAIIEADIIQVQGDTLYALAEYGGLSVIDISNADNLRMLGRYTIRARPFEMYIKSGVAYAMYASFPHYERDASGSYRSVVTSRIVAIDVTNPPAMKELGNFDMPGDLSDSRMVGDIIYVVTYENGSCWGCASNQPRTTVTSIAAADPASIRKVEQLSFADQRSSYGWGYRRSIHVTTDRLYVSGMIFDGAWGPNTGHSTIQVVDISDPAGHLVMGAQVDVNGQIESRWQMDELSGVLRVVSQSGSTWANGPPPVVETFTVQSAQSIVPLGRLTLTLPKRENLKSVRFDGSRAFAVTFEQIDPLFTLDLTDPAAPKQVGEVEMPGFLHHMEPRGDRLIALGVDSGNKSGGLTVSIFDISDLAHPTLLSRANFGTTWGGLPEDQDRIHKAFRIFDQQGLVVMPFSGWVSSGSPFGCGRYVSGVQLLDFSRDQVTARGIVPLRGNARRAFLHKDTLFAVSDDQVASFNIDDRDAPVGRGKLALANVADKTVRFGDYLVELGSDWWTIEPQITVIPIADGSQGVPVATIDLARAINTDNGCYNHYWGSFAANAQLFVEGNAVYVAYDAGFAGQERKGRMGFAVIDMSDPAHPALSGSAVLEIVKSPPQSYGYGYYGCGIGYYSNPTGIWQSGGRIVKLGTTVIVQELVPVDVPGTPDAGFWWYSPPKPTKAILHAVDLSDPAKIHLASTIAIDDGQSASGIFATDSQLVFTSHQEDLVGQVGRTRFFVDRVDFSDPSKPSRSKINAPGSLLGIDGNGERVVTVDYRQTATPIEVNSPNWTPCQVEGGFAQATYSYRDGRIDACLRTFRTLKLVALTDGEATLLDSFEPKGEFVSAVETGNDRIWIVRPKYVPSSSSPSADGGGVWQGGYNEMKVETLIGIRGGHFEPMSTVTRPGSGFIPQPDGTRFVIEALNSSPSRVVVVDTADAARPVDILERVEERYGYYHSTSAITLDPRYLIWSMGKNGAMAFPLD